MSEIDTAVDQRLIRDIWVGAAYATSSPRILILGESVYSNGPPLQDYVPIWFAGGKDHTFTRVFNAFSGRTSSRASKEERKDFWDRIVFYNFVIKSVGPTRWHRPTREAYLEAGEPLRAVLLEHRPQGVLILGCEQAQYSAPIVSSLGIKNAVLRHPAGWGVPTVELINGWTELHQQLGYSS